MSNKLFIDPLFSFPVMIPEETFEMDEDTKHFIENLEKQSNESNFISKSKYIFDEPRLKKLSNWIMKYLNVYFKEVIKVQDCEIYITQSWANYTYKTQRHARHNHPNSLLSGVFYLQGEGSKLNFYRGSNNEQFALQLNASEYTILNSGNYSYDTKENGVIIFPSKLSHDVGVQEIDKLRISISFNTWARGLVGSDDEADKLELK